MTVMLISGSKVVFYLNNFSYRIKKKFHLMVYYIFCFLLLSSCNKEIEIDMPETEPRLVLNCLIEAGQPLLVHLSQTTPVTTDTLPYISKGSIEILVNEDYIETLSYIDNGLYKSDHIAQAGNTYTIKASAEGFPAVKATDKLPYPVSIIAALSSVGSFYYESEGETGVGYEFKTSFSDPQDRNYYELLFLKHNVNTISSTFLNYISCHVADSVFSDEDYFGYDPHNYIFNDNTFNGGTIEVIMKMKDQYRQFEYPSSLDTLPNGNYTVLRTVSEPYYLFMKSWMKHYFNLQYMSYESIDLVAMLLGIGTNPVPLYSNVENGFGLVAAYSQVYYQTELIDLRKCKK